MLGHMTDFKRRAESCQDAPRPIHGYDIAKRTNNMPISADQQELIYSLKWFNQLLDIALPKK